MKLGLALGGGGAKGSYQIGVLKALYEENLLDDLKIVSGTSIGSLNACLVIGKMNIDDMIELWKKISNDTLYNNGLNRFKSDRLGLFDQRVMYDVLVSKQNPLEIINSDIIGYAAVTKIIDNQGIRFQLKKENTKGEVLCLNTSNDPHLIVLASSSVPVIFGPTEIDGNYYVDGGLYDNLPVDVLVKEDCDVIITIGLTPGYDLNIYNSNNDKTIIDFSPKKKLANTLLGMLDFNMEQMEKRFDLGYFQAKMLINKLKEDNVIIKNQINNQKKGIFSL